MKNNTELTEKELAIQAYRTAKEKYHAAVERFNWATSENFDIANEELTLALHQYNFETKRLKTLLGEDAKNV